MTNDSNAPDGERAAKRSFAITENDIGRDPTLPHEVKAVYMALAGYANEHRRCFPGQDRIAYESSLSVRTVGKAIKIGAECGLWTVTRTQGVNRYHLHDHVEDPIRYVVGSGPREAPEPPIGISRRSETQQAPIRTARSADEQDKTTGPESTTSSYTSGGDTPVGVANAPDNDHDEQWQRTRWINVPDWYYSPDCPDTEFRRYVIGAAIEAIKAAGLTPHPGAAQGIGRTMKRKLSEHSRRDQVDFVIHVVRSAGDPTHVNGWIGERRAA